VEFSKSTDINLVVRHTVHELSSYKDKFENISEYVLAVRLNLINVYDAKGACVILQQFPGRQEYILENKLKIFPKIK